MSLYLECGSTECEAPFHELLAMEFADPASGAVHHLTVATYTLQHSACLSRDGWLFERQFLEACIQQAADPAQVRRAHHADVDSGRRTFKFKSGDSRPLFTGILWGQTVRDARSDSADAYREDVAGWARQILLDSQQALMETHES